MRLTNETLAAFVGGDLSVSNNLEGYVRRGPIKGASIEGGTLKIRFGFLAEQGWPVNMHRGDRWEASKAEPVYEAPLSEVQAQNPGTGIILFNVPDRHETGVFLPAGSESQIRPEDVRDFSHS